MPVSNSWYSFYIKEIHSEKSKFHTYPLPLTVSYMNTIFSTTSRTKTFGQFRFQTSRYFGQMCETYLSEIFIFMFLFKILLFPEIYCPKYRNIWFLNNFHSPHRGRYYVFPTPDSVTRNVPQVKDRVWKKKEFHFDNIVDGFFTLYACSTGEGWPG